MTNPSQDEQGEGQTEQTKEPPDRSWVEFDTGMRNRAPEEYEQRS